MIGVQTTDLRIDEGNVFSDNVLPAMLLNWAPTPDRAGQGRRRRAEAARPRPGPAARVHRGRRSGTARPRRRDHPRRRRGDGGRARRPARRRRTRLAAAAAAPRAARSIKGNRFNSNTIGPWLIGSHSDTLIEDNEIAHNDGGGLWLGFPTSFGSSVAQADDVVLRGNRIFDNYRVGFNIPAVAALGFDLLEPKAAEVSTQAFGVTANDPGRRRQRPERPAEHPDVLSVQSLRGSMAVNGAWPPSRRPPTRSSCSPTSAATRTARGEGQTPLGTVDVTTDGAGNATFLLPMHAARRPGAV